MQAATLTAGLALGFALGQAVRRLACPPAAREAVLPGDDLLPAAPVQVDRVVTVRAAPEAVWPWLAQLGQHRAGFYTLPVLDQAIGCDSEAAKRIHPEWQDVHAGDAFPVAPFITLRVAAVSPGSASSSPPAVGRSPRLSASSALSIPRGRSCWGAALRPPACTCAPAGSRTTLAQLGCCRSSGSPRQS